MGMTLPVAELIAREHQRSAFRGRGLEFGKSTIFLAPDQLKALFGNLGLTPRSSTIELDLATTAAKQHPNREFITNDTFYRWLGLDQIDVLDVSDFEGADIVHDVCTPIPDRLVNAYDFVYDSSVLDNVFDPVAALRNMAAAVKPGGRLIQVNAVYSDAFPYLAFTCGWFLDYFALNDFPRCQVYLAQFDSQTRFFGPWTLWGCLPLSRQKLSAPTIAGSLAVAIVIAEKGRDSTVDRNPVQGHYRSQAESDRLDERFDRYLDNSLPFHLFNPHEFGVGGIQRINEWNWIYCGRLGQMLPHRT